MSGNDRRIAYSCPYVPGEWIAAHGFAPSRLRPRSAEPSGLGLRAGMCSYAHSFAESVRAQNDLSGVVVTTLCDQMRRISEVIAREVDSPVFLMHMPVTWESPNARAMYASEIERLGRFLVRLGGRSPSREELVSTMDSADRARASERASKAADVPDGIPIGLVGGPLPVDQTHIVDAIGQLGGRVVLDGTETGERAIPPPFDRELMTRDPRSALVDAYFSIPDASRRPNTMLYRWLERKIEIRRVKGLICIRHLWCDAWHAECARMKESLGIPFFELDVNEVVSDRNRMLTRLQAFMELVR